MYFGFLFLFYVFIHSIIDKYLWNTYYDELDTTLPTEESVMCEAGTHLAHKDLKFIREDKL